MSDFDEFSKKLLEKEIEPQKQSKNE